MMGRADTVDCDEEDVMNRSRVRPLRWLGLGLAGLLGACTNGPAPTPTPPRPQPPASVAAPKPAPTPPASQAKAGPLLPPPMAVTTHDELRRQAAQRIVAANPERTYMTPSPDVLTAIPVLEVELNGDGSVKHVRVLRYPTQAPESVQIAIDAVKRAAPFGDLRHLPKPWAFTETFLFDDDLRFKPRSLD